MGLIVLLLKYIHYLISPIDYSSHSQTETPILSATDGWEVQLANTIVLLFNFGIFIIPNLVEVVIIYCLELIGFVSPNRLIGYYKYIKVGIMTSQEHNIFNNCQLNGMKIFLNEKYSKLFPVNR